MKRLDFFESYFVHLYKKFGISKLNYDGQGLLRLEDRDLRNMVFSSDDFSNDYDSLLEHCRKVYRILKRSYLITVRRDFSNNYYVTID